MTDKPPDTCPLGPGLQHYWDRLSDTEKKMELDEEGLFSLALQPVALEIAHKTPGRLVADAFCGAGGMTIGFARAGKRVAAIESDKKRLGMAERNASLFGVRGSVEFIHGDALTVLPDLNPDTVFLDPPWGGTDYNEKGKFEFSDFEPDGTKLLDAAFSVSRSVIMRLPKNFNLGALDSLGLAYELQENLFGGRLLHYCAYFKSAG